MGEDKELVSHTRKVAFRACRRRHHYAYDLGVRPIKSAIQLVIGSVLHLWLECWFNYHRDPTPGGSTWTPPSPSIWLIDDPVSWDLLEAMESGFARLDNTDPFEAARLRAMVLAYHLRWGGWPMHVLGVEREFVAPLVNPIDGAESKRYARHGKIDAIVEFPGAPEEYDGVWLFEHKSNNGPLDPDSAYFAKLRMDPQCSDYWIGARSLGYEPRGIIYDVVCKPKLEPYKATPAEDRRMTIGDGCRACEGSKGERGDGKHRRWVSSKGKMAQPGARGAVPILSDPEAPCAECSGTGWRNAPRWVAGTRLEDETPGAFGMRCFETMLAEPARYLIRHKVVRLADELREYEVDDWFTVRSMHEQRASGAAPRNPDACFLFHRPCDYFAVCSGAARLDDERLYRISKRNQPEAAEVTE